MRELKFHEKKLLKKVDFLNVCPFSSLYFPPHLILLISSGSKMAIFEKSKSCGGTLYNIERTTTSRIRPILSAQICD